MANERENGINYTVYENGGLGEVRIADEVIAVIAGIAATEVEGVESMAGNIQKELISRLGMKTLSKGVRVSMEEDGVAVDLAIALDYGFAIPEVTKNVQEKVKTSIETMTGLQVKSVDVRIADVKMEEE